MEKPQKEEEIFELKFTHLAPEVWEALGNLLRTGWVDKGVQNPESVQEHIISLRELAFEISEHLEDFSEEEKEKLLDMLEIHDWPEALEGDQVILSTDKEELKKLHADKFEIEHTAMIKICAPLGEDGEKILSLWMDFETSDDKVSNLARQLDKYQTMEKAWEYEQEQGIPLVQEFITNSRSKITHPVLLEKIRQIEEGLLNTE